MHKSREQTRDVWLARLVPSLRVQYVENAVPRESFPLAEELTFPTVPEVVE